MKTKTKLKPIFLNTADLRWITSALGRDHTRPVMMLAHVFHRDGSAWLISSNSSTLHALRLGDDKQVPEMSFDARALLSDMAWYRVTEVSFDNGKWNLLRGNPEEPLAIFDADRFSRTHGNVPDWTRAVPVEPIEVVAPFAINWRFFAAACKKAWACKTVLRMNSPSSPLLITPIPVDAWKCEWFAVIMPMALGV